MKLPIQKNEGLHDRFLRALLAELFFMGAYFWVEGVWSIVFYILGFLALGTALFGYCGLYSLLGVKTCPVEPKKASPRFVVVYGILLVLVAVVGSYYSAFFTKKFFLDDYNRMNNYYKQTLFYTGQEKRSEAIANYEKLTAEYAQFLAKYTVYHPYAIKKDVQFNSDLEKVSGTISALQENVYTGDLKQAHVGFEAVRPIFQDMLKRNNFSMLAVALVDFHDAMEKIITAGDAKSAEQVLAVYPEVDAKLKAVEEIADDAEIQTIRANLEAMLSLAKNGQVDALPAKGAELKSSFVKVYLKRG